MCNVMILLSISSLTLTLLITNAQQIEYLNGLPENETCELDANNFGSCRLISECLAEYKSYRRNLSVLKVCSYHKVPSLVLVCCKEQEQIKNDDGFPSDSNIGKRTWNFTSPPDKVLDVLDYKTCRQEFLKYRASTINPDLYSKAIYLGDVEDNEENQRYLDELHKIENPDILRHIRWHFNPLHGKLVEKGSRPNMVAIGWTQANNTIVYNCGGTLVTERFIITAAHCKFFNGKQADTVRVGDPFLITAKYDETAQQHMIEKFILHPNFDSRYRYNDIALVKIATNITFDTFVVPSCFYDLHHNLNDFEHFTEWTVAGYGVTEHGKTSNILLELKVRLVLYEECNKTFANDVTLPNGIQPSQFCVKSTAKGKNLPDTCFGDSGSPLQFNVIHEVLHEDFNTSYLSTVYQIPTTLGIVSFGSHCGFDAPSVYTRIAYFKDWIREAIKNN